MGATRTPGIEPGMPVWQTNAPTMELHGSVISEDLFDWRKQLDVSVFVIRAAFDICSAFLSNNEANERTRSANNLVALSLWV